LAGAGEALVAFAGLAGAIINGRARLRASENAIARPDGCIKIAYMIGERIRFPDKNLVDRSSPLESFIVGRKARADTYSKYIAI